MRCRPTSRAQRGSRRRRMGTSKHRAHHCTPPLQGAHSGRALFAASGSARSVLRSTHRTVVGSASAAPRHRRAAADGLCVCVFASMSVFVRLFVCFSGSLRLRSSSTGSVRTKVPCVLPPTHPATSQAPLPTLRSFPSTSARRHNPIPLAMRCDSAGPSGASLSSVRRFDDGCAAAAHTAAATAATCVLTRLLQVTPDGL
jgi:hypothetical protein